MKFAWRPRWDGGLSIVTEAGLVELTKDEGIELTKALNAYFAKQNARNAETLKTEYAQRRARKAAQAKIDASKVEE